MDFPRPTQELLRQFYEEHYLSKISKEGIKNMGKAVELMAEAEGLQAHKNAITLRLNDL